jgi:hypothetical protein
MFVLIMAASLLVMLAAIELIVFSQVVRASLAVGLCFVAVLVCISKSKL